MLRNTFLLFTALIGFLAAGCVEMSQVETTIVQVPKTRITFLLIDNSLSYNNPNDENSQRVMAMVKKQISDRLKAARPGERIFVRTIQSESNQLSAFLTQLNLDDESLYFMEPKPSNPIELKVWQKDKRDFEATIGDKMQGKIDTALAEFETRGQAVFSQPSNRTDFIGALLACQRFFSKGEYNYKNLAIYSDMIEDAALEDDSLLDLSGVEVQAKFVTKPASEGAKETHRYFLQLERKWEAKLKAAKFQLFEVQNSF